MNFWSALSGDDTFSLEVVGIFSCQPELEDLSEGYPEDKEHRNLAILIPEVDNPYSRTVVRVEIGHRTVGYLSQADAQAFHASLAKEFSLLSRPRRFRCAAKIRRATGLGWGGRGYWTVHLDVCLPQA